jgi:peroxiredoxin
MDFRTLLPVGSSAPDFEARLLETGQSVKLSEYWKKSDVLIEFGSFT